MTGDLLAAQVRATMGRVVSTDGAAITFSRSGAGPPLILVHGLGRDHRSWGHLLPAFAPHLTVYAVDRRGRGRSEAGSRYSFAQEADDLLAVIAAAGEPVHLLGASLGAICAMEAALRTDRLRSLVLYEPPIRLAGDGPSLNPTTWGRRQRDARDRLDVLAALQGSGDVASLPDGWQERAAVARTYPRELRALYRYVFDPARFRALRTPTLLLRGDSGIGPSFFGRATAALDAALPDSRIVTLAGQGHMAIFTAPEMFTGAVLPFLRAH